MRKNKKIFTYQLTLNLLLFISLSFVVKQANAECVLGEILPYESEQSDQSLLPAEGGGLAISQFTTLFALLGIRFGGDGRGIFAVPNIMNSTLGDDGEKVKMGICVEGIWPTYFYCKPGNVYYIAGNRYPYNLVYTDGTRVPEYDDWDTTNNNSGEVIRENLPDLPNIIPANGPQIRAMICID